MAKLSEKDRVDIVEAYLNWQPMISLAAKYGVTRAYIYKIVKAAGVDASKKGGVKVTCFCCQQEVIKPRNRARTVRHIFCDKDCYYAWLRAGRHGGAYVQSGQGQRIARKVVSEYITLLEGYVVHHINRNTLDNQPHNLMVFRTQGDHVRHHRGFEVEPIWDGSKI